MDQATGLTTVPGSSLRSATVRIIGVLAIGAEVPITSGVLGIGHGAAATEFGSLAITSCEAIKPGFQTAIQLGSTIISHPVADREQIRRGSAS
jgi:hypothetical protein